MDIHDFEHLKEIPEIKFKEEEVNGHKFTIVSYMIATQELWDIPLAKECRGITFNEAGEIVCRPFEKFFNLNENPSTQQKIIESWKNPIALDKRDGSMLSAVRVNGKFFWKTKKSFYSDVALDCQKFADELNQKTNGEFYNVLNYLTDMDQTCIFEFTSPDNKIVIDYGSEPELTLLAVRGNACGVYYHHQKYAEMLGVKSIPEFPNKTLTEILDDIPGKKGIEGYVLFDRDTQQRVKIKTVWYINLHRINTDLRVRDVVEMILDETIDDVKSTIVMNGMSLDPILDIEHQVRMKFEQIVESTKHLASVGKGMERKEFAIENCHNSLFGLAIKEIDGRDPDYKRYFKNNYLKTFSLRGVYNVNFGQKDDQ